ncbi:hypothetical protein [Vulcanisaeta distributa]|nr:hypothetical protein [Vulcanisaeta distributa]
MGRVERDVGVYVAIFDVEVSRRGAWSYSAMGGPRTTGFALRPLFTRR